jgi:hypothetical protein
MRFVYQVESCFDPVVDSIRDTLLYHCEKGVWIKMPVRRAAFRFKVFEDTIRGIRGPAVKVKGILGKCNFTFHSGRDGASFPADYYGDAENTFRQFVVMMDVYRRDRGLEPLELDRICDIAEKDSPPVTGDNYAFFAGADSGTIGAFQDLLDRKFAGTAHREICGKYSVVVYSENSRATEYFCVKNTPVYQKFLGTFKALYGFSDVMLVCARRRREQYVYFYVRGIGTFYNTEDSSKVFLERKHGLLTKLLLSAIS